MMGWQASSNGRKRDIKGGYKAKFNIEKLMIEHEKKKVSFIKLI
jgi:hypothetical protein